jgi:hypothetical protein
VYERDNYTCQNCGRPGGEKRDVELHAHHIVPKSSGGTHSKSNLKTLCKDCHSAVHGDSLAPSAADANKENSTQIGAHPFSNLEPFKNCPICGCSDSFKIYPNRTTKSEKVIADCTSCLTEFYTEFNILDFGYAGLLAKNSECNINGCVFQAEILKKMEKEGVENNDEIKEYLHESHEYKSRINRTMAATCGFMILSIILGAISGNFIIIFSGIIISLLVGLAVLKKLDSEIKQ